MRNDTFREQLNAQVMSLLVVMETGSGSTQVTVAVLAEWVNLKTHGMMREVATIFSPGIVRGIGHICALHRFR